MTRRIERPADGLLLSDQGADRIDLLRDLDGDGDALDPGERRMFFGPANGDGLADPTGNVFTLLQASDGAVFVGDGDTDAVYRLIDRDGDGDAMDAGEATVWLSEAASAAGLTLPTPNGLAEGPDGAIYVVNAGVSSRPDDAIWRTRDLNGDGDAQDAGEATVWLDLSRVTDTSSPYELRFVGDVAYLLDPNGAGQDVIWRIEDADGSGDVAADEVSVFIGGDMDFGATIDFAYGGVGDVHFLWEWLDRDGGVHGLYKLIDVDGSGAIDAPGEVSEVWDSTLLPEGFSPFAGFSVAAARTGEGALRVALTSNGGEAGEDWVAVLTDLNRDGDFRDEGETAVFGSRLDDAAGFERPRAVEFYESDVRIAPTLAGAGNHFSLFLEGGTLYAAGENVVGQLAQGVTGFDVPAPLEVDLPADFESEIEAVSAGLVHGGFLTAEGDVWSWGLGVFGRLGLGDEEIRTVPRKIEALDDADVELIDFGNGASYAISADGTLYGWGQNSNGQLGLGDREARLTPVELPVPGEVVAVSSGTGHTLALNAAGELWAFGSNSSGQLGSPAGLEEGEPVRRVLTPAKVEGLPEGARVVAVTADANTSYAVLEDGRVFGWGEGAFGQLLQGERLGDGTFLPQEDDALAPVELIGLPGDVIDVKGGARWAAALTASGDVWLWGPDDEGPSGGLDGDPDDESDAAFLPTRLEALDAETAVEIQTGPNHLIAVTADGRFLTFGSNSDGRLGYPTEGPTTEPREVAIGEDDAPWLLTATPGDNARDVAPDADLVLTFTKAVTAGEGAIRLVNREDPEDVIEVAAADAARVSIEGETATIDPPGLLRPGARYAVEIDPEAFVDLAGRSFPGLPLEDASDFDFRVDAEAAVLLGDDGRDRLAGTDADELIATGAGRYDVAAGGGGADVFVFGAETSNDVRETDLIRDYEAGVDALDLGGAGIASIRETARFVTLTLEGDGDVVMIQGVGDADDLVFV